MEATPTVAFVLGCVDFRHHKQEAEVVAQLEVALDADEVYFCTTAGPDGVMVAKGVRHDAAMEDAMIIKEAKGASVFAVLGHYGCAGHNVTDDQHDADTMRAAEIMSRAIGQPTWPLILHLNGGDGPTWKIKKLSEEPVTTAVAA